MKHLRGKHDQKDHGRREFRNIGGGVLGRSPSPSLDEAVDIIRESNLTSARLARKTLSDSRLGIRDRMDAVREDMRIYRAEMVQAQKAWRRASKAGNTDAARSFAERFGEAYGSYEGARSEYNSTLDAYQRAEGRGRYAVYDAEGRRIQPQRRLAPSPEQRQRTTKPMDPASYLVKGTTSQQLATLGADGLPSVGRVEMGANGISSVQDAVRFLDAGGDLNGIPDDVLLESMKRSSRFTRSALNVHGINGAPTMLTDTQTGRQYIAKYGARAYLPNEDIAEVLGNNIAGRLGFPVGGQRFAGPSADFRPAKSSQTGLVPGRPVVMEHLNNYIDGGVRRPSWGSKPALADSVALGVLDYLILNPDRHGDNYFEAGSTTQPNLVPVDQSMGFQNIRFREGDSPAGSSDSWGDRRGFQAFTSNVRNGPFVDLRVAHDAMNSQERRQFETQIAAEIRRAQTRLREAEDRAPFISIADTATRAAGRPDPNNPSQMLPRVGVDWDATSRQRGTERLMRNPDERIRYFMNADADQLARDIFAN